MSEHIIHKYNLSGIGEDQEVLFNLPKGAKPLSVATQKDEPVMWFLVPVNAVTMKGLIIHRIMTGHKFNKNIDMSDMDFIGTTLQLKDNYVSHWFWERT